MNPQLSIERLGLLLRADLMLRARTVAIVLATLAALMLVQGMLTAAFGDPRANIFGPWFYGVLYVWGAIVASYSFGELHDKSRNQAYLLLPASALEKTLSRLLIATLLFVPFVYVFIMVASWLNAGLTFVFFDAAMPVFNPGEYLRAEVLGQALTLQSVFFLGAAWFRRSHFVKTAFAVTSISIALSLVAAGIGWLVFRDVILAGGPDFGANGFANLQTSGRLGAIVYYVVLPPFCWWVAWLRVRETQVSYGV